MTEEQIKKYKQIRNSFAFSLNNLIVKQGQDIEDISGTAKLAGPEGFTDIHMELKLTDLKKIDLDLLFEDLRNCFPTIDAIKARQSRMDNTSIEIDIVYIDRY